MKPVYWITSGLLCAAGVAVMVAGAVIYDRTPKESFSKEFVSEEIHSIEMDLNDCSLTLAASEETEHCTVEFSGISGKAEAAVRNGTLYVKNTAVVRIISFGTLFSKGSVTVYVPAQEYESLKLDLDAVSSGSVTGLNTRKLSLDLDACELDLENVSAAEKKAVFDLDACTLHLQRCSFPETELDVDAGSFTANNTEIAKLDCDMDASLVELDVCSLGDINMDIDAATLDMQGITLSGDMRLEGDASTIQIGIAGKKELYSVILNGDANTLQVDGEKGSVFNRGSRYTIAMDCDACGVEVTFEEE